MAKIKEGADISTGDLPDMLQQTSILLLELMEEQQNVQIQQQQEAEQQQQQAVAQEQQSGQGEAGIPSDSGGRPQMEEPL